MVRDVPLEDYVQASSISEVAPAAGELDTVERMLEVQTIIGRTYAVSHLARHAREGFDLCSTTHCQLFDPRRLQTSRWAPASLEAVGRTSGLILTFDRLPIQALFHADCGGHTSTAAAVWGGTDRPYLVARPDDGVPSEAHADWKYEVSVGVLTAALATDSRMRVTGLLDTIEVVSRDGAGRAERIALHGHVQNAGGTSSQHRNPRRRAATGADSRVRSARHSEHALRRAAHRLDVHVLWTRLWPRRRALPGRRSCPAARRRHTGGRPRLLLSGGDAGSRLRAQGSGAKHDGSGLKAQGSGKILE